MLYLLASHGLLAFLVTCLIIVVVCYAIYLVLAALKVPSTIQKIVWLIMAVIVIIYLLERFAGVVV